MEDAKTTIATVRGNRGADQAVSYASGSGWKVWWPEVESDTQEESRWADTDQVEGIRLTVSEV